MADTSQSTGPGTAASAGDATASVAGARKPSCALAGAAATDGESGPMGDVSNSGGSDTAGANHKQRNVAFNCCASAPGGIAAEDQPDSVADAQRSRRPGARGSRSCHKRNGVAAIWRSSGTARNDAAAARKPGYTADTEEPGRPLASAATGEEHGVGGQTRRPETHHGPGQVAVDGEPRRETSPDDDGYAR
ncbi:MAG: hypothetical protein ACYTAS_15005 [Planctomycetota bacterium]